MLQTQVRRGVESGPLFEMPQFCSAVKFYYSMLAILFKYKEHFWEVHMVRYYVIVCLLINFIYTINFFNAELTVMSYVKYHERT